MGSQVSRAAFQPPFPPPEIPSPATTTEYGRLRVEELGVTVARVLCRGSENVDAQQSASGTLSRRRQILLFSHGNAEDVASIGPWMEIVAEELHVDVFAYDYPGYGAPDEGRSALEPSEAGAFACARAAYRHLRDEMKIDPRDIVLFGRSLGTGMTVELASSYAASGVILQSPLRSAIRVVQNTPFSLPFDIMVNQEKLPKVCRAAFGFDFLFLHLSYYFY
jgi:pimeloyl-ACP methyl ester carboxylesterase